MPLINIKMMAGRDDDKKRRLVKKMTDVICETLDCPADAVRISIEDMPPENYAIGGVLILDKQK